MITVVNSVSRRNVEAFQDQVVTIYRDAFRAPPYGRGEEEVVGFARSLAQHTQREGFCMMLAVEGKSDRAVGLAYGYTNAAGQWWHDTVAKAVLPSMAAEWLADSFQLAEIAVTPELQGRGIGGLLHDHLLGGLPHRRAVLSTLRAQTRAYRMYHKRGWVVLLESVFFPGVARAYQILGRDLRKE